LAYAVTLRHRDFKRLSMRTKYLGCFWVTLLGLCLGCAPLHAQTTPLRVLFVGNSYTYYHQMPQLVAVLAQASGMARPLEVHQETIPGTPLPRVLGTRGVRQAVLDNPWDVVVFQIMPYPWLDRPADVVATLKEVVPGVRAKGGKPVYYLTWSGDARPDPLVLEPKVYSELAQETGAVLAPAGKAWVLAKAAQPSLKLVDNDGHHPSPLGSLLAACVVYRTLFPEAGPCKPPEGTTTSPEQMAVLDAAAARAAAQ
jgi:hypothetical protein